MDINHFIPGHRPENHKIEVQIRTPEMHNIAEHGVAAHWKYKDPIQEINTRKIKWIQELVGILDEEAGADEFLEHTSWTCIRIRFLFYAAR